MSHASGKEGYGSDQGTEANAAVDAELRATIETLIYEHAWRVDHHCSDQLYELYTEDGTLQLPSTSHRGHAELRKYGTERAKMTRRQSRHVSSNLRLARLAPDRVRGMHTVTLFRHDGTGCGPASPCAVADVHDVYVRSRDNRWLIAERRIELAFESEEHRKPYK